MVPLSSILKNLFYLPNDVNDTNKYYISSIVFSIDTIVYKNMRSFCTSYSQYSFILHNVIKLSISLEEGKEDVKEFSHESLGSKKDVLM